MQCPKRCRGGRTGANFEFDDMTRDCFNLVPSCFRSLFPSFFFAMQGSFRQQAALLGIAEHQMPLCKPRSVFGLPRQLQSGSSSLYRPCRANQQSNRVQKRIRASPTQSRDFQGPDALLFDCDGVLVDTEAEGHRIAFNKAFKEKGHLL